MSNTLYDRKKVLLICGSLNQTTMMHQISKYLIDCDCYFTPYYADGIVNSIIPTGLLDWTILAGSRKASAIQYIKDNKLNVDHYGAANDYELVITCSDLIIPKNIKRKKIVLVQEGMTNPKNLGFYLVKWFKMPTYFGDTASTGLSDAYDIFCVASQGYKDFFIDNGVNPSKIKVTGIPNYDNCAVYYNNTFPHKNYVLVATSDTRECYMYENRKKFIENALIIANGRQLIFKLHPNEKVDRAVKEINTYAPEALVFPTGNVHEMIANCNVLITRFSTVVYTGIALNKEVYSYFKLSELKKTAPLQNSGSSAYNIALECLNLLNSASTNLKRKRYISNQSLNKIKDKFSKTGLFKIILNSKKKKAYSI